MILRIFHSLSLSLSHTHTHTYTHARTLLLPFRSLSRPCMIHTIKTTIVTWIQHFHSHPSCTDRVLSKYEPYFRRGVVRGDDRDPRHRNVRGSFTVIARHVRLEPSRIPVVNSREIVMKRTCCCYSGCRRLYGTSVYDDLISVPDQASQSNSKRSWFSSPCQQVIDISGTSISMRCSYHAYFLQ